MLKKYQIITLVDVCNYVIINYIVFTIRKAYTPVCCGYRERSRLLYCGKRLYIGLFTIIIFHETTHP